MKKLVDIDCDAEKAYEILTALYGLCQEKGRPVIVEPQTENLMNLALNNTASRFEDVVKFVIKRNLSDGPNLTNNWIMKKRDIWAGSIPVTDYHGVTRSGWPKPPWANSPDTRAAFTGTFYDNIEGWRAGYKNYSVRIGYRKQIPHPISGKSIIEIANNIHYGLSYDARPFINSEFAKKQYFQIFREEIIDMVTNI